MISERERNQTDEILFEIAPIYLCENGNPMIKHNDKYNMGNASRNVAVELDIVGCKHRRSLCFKH